MSPRDVLKNWVARFNAADVDDITKLYADHAANPASNFRVFRA
jgi:hypothetical protein